MSPAARAMQEKVNKHTNQWRKDLGKKAKEKGKVKGKGNEKAGGGGKGGSLESKATEGHFRSRSLDDLMRNEAVEKDEGALEEGHLSFFPELDFEDEQGFDEVGIKSEKLEADNKTPFSSFGCEMSEEEYEHFPVDGETSVLSEESLPPPPDMENDSDGYEYEHKEEEDMPLPPDSDDEERYEDGEEVDLPLPPPPVNKSRRRLDPAWILAYDNKKKKNYYFNTVTGESSWKRPKMNRD